MARLERKNVKKRGIDAAAVEAPMESLSLNFTRITDTFTGHDPGISGSRETVGYDLAQMKTV
jgi:hypothetical protein